ncbi:RING-type E3 ubiquitin transferase [Sarracenia purpurea var. burkii]
MHTGFTGRRTKSAARKAIPVRASNFSIEEPVKKEELPTEDCPESSSSPKTLDQIVQYKRQSCSPTKPFHDQLPSKDKENGAVVWERNVDLWKPLNCLVEAANRTKSSKFSPQYSSTVKLEPVNASDYEIDVPRTKITEHQQKLKVQDDKNKKSSFLGLVKRRRLRTVDRKNAAGGLRASTKTMLDAHGAKQNRKRCPIWFSLVASEDQEGGIPLPQISACYLRIKDGSLPVSFIQKYLVKKLDLTSEAEVEILCRGQPVLPTLQLRSLVDLWLQTASTSKRVPATVGSSAKDFVMVLSYSRKVVTPAK